MTILVRIGSLVPDKSEIDCITGFYEDVFFLFLQDVFCPDYGCCSEDSRVSLEWGEYCSPVGFLRQVLRCVL